MAPTTKPCYGNHILGGTNSAAQGCVAFDVGPISNENLNFLEQLVVFCKSKKMNESNCALPVHNGFCNGSEDVDAQSTGFREKLSLYFGKYLPTKVVDELCSLVHENSYGKCMFCLLPTESLVLSVLQILLDGSNGAEELKEKNNDDLIAHGAHGKGGSNDFSSTSTGKGYPLYCSQPLNNVGNCVTRGNNESSCDKKNASAMKSQNTTTTACDPEIATFIKKPIIPLETPIVMHQGNVHLDPSPRIPVIQKKARRSYFVDQRCNQLLSKGSPDVVCLGSVSLGDRCAQMGKVADQIYNQRSSTVNPVGSIIDLTKGLHGEVKDKCVVLDLSAKSNQGGTNSVKRTVRDMDTGDRFSVTAEERSYYDIICGIAKSQWSCYKAIDINKTCVFYSSLGESIEAGGKVDNFFIAGMCGKFFYDCHPKHSKKHFFYPNVGSCLLTYNSLYDLNTIQRCFLGANSAHKLHLSHKLCFPIFLSKHWFVFIVDLENKLFVFLDSYFDADSYFQKDARTKLINGFKASWYQHAGGKVNVDLFEVSYPPVPKQKNVFDCGIFALKFMELWDNSIDLTDLFDHNDIPNIRVKMGVDLFFSKGNTVDKSLVLNMYEQGIDPLVCT